MGCCHVCYDISDEVFARPGSPNYTSEDPYKIIEITTPRNKKTIPAYYLPCSEKFGGEERCKTTILYSHGNREDLGSTYSFIQRFHNNLPVNVLSYEYVGFGLSDDSQPSEDLTYDSIEGAFLYLLREKKIQLSDIILFGTSLGNGPTIHLSTLKRVRSEICGTVMLCPFTSMIRSRTGENEYLSLFLEYVCGIDMFSNISKAPSIESPVLLIHGKDDTIFNVDDHAKTMYSKVPQAWRYKCVLVDGADHGNVISKHGNKRFNQLMLEYVNYCVSRKKKEVSEKNKEL